MAKKPMKKRAVAGKIFGTALVVLCICAVATVGGAFVLASKYSSEKLSDTVSSEGTGAGDFLSADGGEKADAGTEGDAGGDTDDGKDVLVINGDTDAEEVAEDTVFPYYIRVNRLQNVVTVYMQGEDGTYNVPVKAFLCSTGRNLSTPKGFFTISDKYEWLYMFGGVYTQYACRISKHILLHSVPYYTRSKSNLEYNQFNKLGDFASMGCIRLACGDIAWIYENCPSGTIVEIYDDEDPGPLGKPEQILIDTDSADRGWDPTDPDPANPWKLMEEANDDNV